MKKLTQFITSDTLFKTVLPSVKELVSLLEKKKTNNKIVKIFYGETYDEYGLTIDSLKYYFVLSLIHFHLEKVGFKVESTLIQADIASLLNKSARNKKATLIEQRDDRLDLIKKIIKTYKLPIKVKLMSEIFDSDDYKQNIKLVNQFANTQKPNSPFYENLKKTVLRNRLKQEYHAKFQYAKEAVATSMLFDIKIGPPREQFYDKAQHILAKNLGLNKLIGIYLKPTFPLGQNFAYFLTHPEIEEFGLTPYKAGSNGMQDYRIILGETSCSTVEKLISSSFESENAQTAHPVLDVYLISDLARKFTESNTDLPKYGLANLLKDIPKLRKTATQNLNDFVLKGFKYEK